jgi:hypothetical protein
MTPPAPYGGKMRRGSVPGWNARAVAGIRFSAPDVTKRSNGRATQIL